MLSMSAASGQAYCVQTLTMVLQKQIPLMEKLVLKFGYIKEKFFRQREIRKEALVNYVNAKKSKTS